MLIEASQKRIIFGTFITLLANWILNSKKYDLELDFKHEAMKQNLGLKFGSVSMQFIKNGWRGSKSGLKPNPDIIQILIYRPEKCLPIG